MLILLPPSETKRDGGAEGTRLDLAALSFPSLTPARRRAIAGLRAMSKSVAVSTKALGLGPTQRFEIERNRVVGSSPTMPAIERYTGVLYDAIGASGLPATARRYIDERVVVHSALFGLVRASDPIPAYRFSHDTRIAGASLASIWRTDIAAVLAAEPGPVLDLRSEAYVHLGPTASNSAFVRVVSDAGGGQRRALNHFNKHGKGEFVRALALAGAEVDSFEDLLEFARASGISLERDARGELVLVV